MKKINYITLIVIYSIFLIINIILFGLFSITHVGLSETEKISLYMLRTRISLMTIKANTTYNILSNLTLNTDDLIIILNDLYFLNQRQNVTEDQAKNLQEQSEKQELEIINYNNTIESQFDEELQDKINNINVPQFNLETDKTEFILLNGTVDFSNPHNVNETVKTTYLMKKILNITYLEVDPSSFLYSTFGSDNWFLLNNWDPKIFTDDNIGTGMFDKDQVFDDQQSKLSYPITYREYNPDNNEIKLGYNNQINVNQVISINQKIIMNVGFI